LFLLLCRKAERVADDMRALMTKMKAMQGQLNKVTTTDTLCLFHYFPVLKNILLTCLHTPNFSMLTIGLAGLPEGLPGELLECIRAHAACHC